MNSRSLHTQACRVTWLILVAILSACSTLTNPLVRMAPDYTEVTVDELRPIAEQLEGGVAAEIREPTLTNTVETVIDTPEIAQALKSRAARYQLVQELLDSGFTMEQLDGKISILRSGEYKNAYTSAQKDRHALIVISENRDRVLIYESIQDANSFSAAGRSAIEEVFSSVRIENLKSGQKYQGPDGEALVKD
ncbi:MAG: hypothetical protein VCD00_12110 [Candidatus Hydrogenedentota bacterium]